jgi:hypothetical protein
MNITREMIIKRLSEKSGYWRKDIRVVLQHLDDVVLEYFGEVTNDEDISVQLIRGVKISAHVVPERDRVDPRNGEPIVCKETVKPACKFSDDFRKTLQTQYEEKMDG